MSTITEAQNPVAVLGGGAPDGGMGEYVEGLKKDCGFIISRIDSVVNTLTGFSLLEALFEPIAGDFDTVSSMQKGWGNVGVSLGAVGDNYRSLSGQLPGVWEGQAFSYIVQFSGPPERLRGRAMIDGAFASAISTVCPSAPGAPLLRTTFSSARARLASHATFSSS